MLELSAELNLRPTRVGFLTSPTDMRSVRAVMRACACLWGGVYNPIIPVFKRAPEEWRSEVGHRAKGIEIAKGYARFFEPDVYVETQKGLLEEAGLGSLRQKHTLHPQVISLKEFLEPQENRNWSEPAFGLNIHDVLAHLYKSEQRFVQRDTRECLYVVPEQISGAADAMFGVYPTLQTIAYLKQAYWDVYKPDKVKPTPDVWRKVFLKGAGTPLHTTRYGLDTRRYWYHDLVIFVFDPTRATDLIDLWNLRLEPFPVLPVPLDWFETLSDDIQKILKAEHRPVVGNPNGIMHKATIEFARSITQAKAEGLIHAIKPQLPQGALTIKYWRNAIWIDHRDDRIRRENRLKVTAKTRRIDLFIKRDKSFHTTFEALEPEFAKRYGRGEHRWINVLSVSNYTNHGIAAVLPFNTYDRSWPHLGMGGETVSVGSEGWAFRQTYTNHSQYVTLLSAKDAIAGSLKQFGIEAELSEPGHIARQMLEQLGGLWGVHILAHIGTLKLLNKMAGGLRRKTNGENTIEETFELRTAPLKDWTDLISVRKSSLSLPSPSLKDFTKCDAIRLGLETDCLHCNAKNWHSLSAADYQVTCERCLKVYDFPQAELRKHNKNFTYRVVGPFSVPDYGRGSYSALLTLRVLDRFNSSRSEMTFSTATNLSFDGIRREVDLIAWRSDDRLGLENRRPPQLIIGEAKSLGEGELITSGELAKLKSVAAKLPEAIIVISILRDYFTPAEKRLITKFVNWGRRVNAHGEPTNPIILLTSHELTMDHFLSETWKAAGGAHARFADFEHTRTLLDLADATQQIYLDLPAFHQSRREYWDKRRKQRQRVASVA